MARAAVAVVLALVLVLVATTDARAEDPKPNSCVECHETLDEAKLVAPLKALAGDVHGAAGVSCVDCHGGDAALGTDTGTKIDAMDPKKGYIGRPRGLEVARMCGRCHSDIELMRRTNPREPTDQQAQYLTSVHGKRAAQGDLNVATCASCHGAHGVRRVADPASPVHPMHVVETCTRCHADPEYMKPYSIPTDQLAKYQDSKHGQKRLVDHDPGAPACNTCHGNHGAVPPGVAAVANVCGKCHQSQLELFAPSGHAKAFAKHEIAGCTTCHGNHRIKTPDDSFLSTKEGGLCVACHTPADRCDTGARAMSEGMSALVADIAGAERTLDAADRLGMDVARARFDLAGARDALVRARVTVHAFSPTASADVIKEGREAAASVSAAGEAALAEHAYRRKGLAVAAGCLLLFAAMLGVKARRISP